MIETGKIRSIQVPGGFLQLGKVVSHRFEEGQFWMLVRWIDVRREADEYYSTEQLGIHKP